MRSPDALVLRGSRSIEIKGERITRILPGRLSAQMAIDLDGFLVMPGLINAHDHLQFALYPRLGHPPYRNYIDWGEDIHATLADVIHAYGQIPKHVRLWWGGIRNLLCGVTTVCHHDPLWLELQRKDFPVRVVQRYGWAHSLALGGDLARAYAATPEGAPFMIHACEGVDDLAMQDIFGLDRLGVLAANTVLVHGLAINDAGIALMKQRHASLIVCPSSNYFLFGRLPDRRLINELENTSLGSDSPITGTGDLLDEVRFAVLAYGLSPEQASRMVTIAPANILRLKGGEGTIREGGRADLIAVRDTGEDAASRLATLSSADIELVLVGGEVKLASNDIYARLPLQARNGLECLRIHENARWLRAPVRCLMKEVEEVIGHKRNKNAATSLSPRSLWNALSPLPSA